MDAAKYIKEKKRMCNTYHNCDGCPIKIAREDDYFCSEWILEYTNEAVALVERWSEEHPQRTFKDDFLEKFPKSKYENCCVDYVYGTNFREECTILSTKCANCWNRPINEVR